MLTALVFASGAHGQDFAAAEAENFADSFARAPAFAAAGAPGSVDPLRDVERWNGTRGRAMAVTYENRYGATIAGHLWRPLAGDGPFPAVVLVNGYGETEDAYWWAAEDLAEHGYVVLTWDPQGSGSSEVEPDPEFCDPAGAWRKPQELGIVEMGRCAGMDPDDMAVVSNLEQVAFIAAARTENVDPETIAGTYDRLAARYVLGALDATDFLLSEANPWRDAIQPRRIGIAGHSAGAYAALLAGNGDPRRRFRAAVAMDGFRAAPPQVPLRVPTLLLQSEQENVLGPRAAPPARPRSPRTLHPARRSFKDLVARHVDAGFVVPRASTHSEFTDVGLPASLLGQRTAAHFLLAWMDEYVAGRDGTTRLHARTADATADASSIGIGTPKIAGIDVERLLSRLFPSDLGTCLDLRTTACPLPPRCRPRAVWTRVEGRVLVRLQRPCGRVQEVRVGRRRALIGTGDVVRLRASRGQRVRLVGGRVTHVRGRAAPAGGPESIDTSFTTSDGVVLHATLTGEAPITARPTVVEFTPYGVNTGTFDPGPEFNKLVVEDRGTGRSGGGFDALGPLAQRDVRETLEWACHQPWSNGTLGINGFSASAIVIYNALHLELPCVKAAVLKSGTFELYRDLLSPGGVSNIVPATVVFAGIGGGALAQGGYRDPATDLAAIAGMFASGTGVLQHPTLDDWWRERGFRGDVNNLPILMIGGFYDVESRGAFEAFQALKDDGAHLYVIGAHDQAPRGTDGGRAEMTSWFDRYLRGVRNGVAGHPRVQLWMSRGDRKTHVAGEYLHYGARDWPVPGTRWRRFALSPDKSGTARSINDGTLTPEAPPEVSAASYPATVSETTATDVPNAAIVDAAGFAALSDGFPTLTDMSVAEPLGLSFTSAAFEQDMLSAGPAALSLSLSSTAPTTAIWAVLSDVGPDGVAHPLTVGRLSTDYPNVDVARSRTDPVTGEIVQPYGDFSVRTPAVPGQVRRYQVEFWPLGNVFQAGHRLRLHLVGQSAASLPGVPAVNTVTLGGADPSRLLVPVTPAEKAAVRRRCAFTVRVRKRVRSAVVRIGGRRVARIRHGRHRVRVKLRGRRRGAVRVTVVMRLRDGRRVKRTRTYHPCARG